MFGQPAVPRQLVDSVVDAGVVQHDHGRAAIAGSQYAVDETHNIWTFDGAGVRGVDQRIATEIQSANHAATAVVIRLDLVGQASW